MAKILEDIEKLERRIRLAVYSEGKDNITEDIRSQNLPKIPSNNNWNPPKAKFPEVEHFLLL